MFNIVIHCIILVLAKGQRNNYKQITEQASCTIVEWQSM